MTISTPYPAIAVNGEWRNRALCAGDASPDDWFADPTTPRGQRAERICSMCPVRAGCTSHARAAKEPYGRWGDKLSKTLRERPECGSESGYSAHARRGETPCGECRIAHAEYVAQRRAERRLVPA